MNDQKKPKPDEPGPKKAFKKIPNRLKNDHRIKTLNGNIIDAKDIEWFCYKLLLQTV